MRLGVIIGRFQVPELHEGHRKLIDHVKGQFDEVLIVIGDTPVRGSKRNPLDWGTRYKMLRDAYPDALIQRIMDNASDEAWSKDLDQIIEGVCPIGEKVLFGGRDSFIPHYSGKFKTVAVELGYAPSGTDVRVMASNKIRVSADFRAGVIYATANQYQRVFPTVDIAIIRDGQVLLGKKKNQDAWCFPGGFVDQEDSCLEDAAAREAFEETGMTTIRPLEYVCSHRNADWRYRHKDDGVITTTLFAMLHPRGEAKAADDLDQIGWFIIDEALPSRVTTTHQFLAEALLKKYGTQNPKGESSV